jgi:hypothetical protein
LFGVFARENLNMTHIFIDVFSLQIRRLQVQVLPDAPFAFAAICFP